MVVTGVRTINLDYTESDVTDKGVLSTHYSIPVDVVNHVATDTLKAATITGKAGAGQNLNIAPTGNIVFQNTDTYITGSGNLKFGSTTPIAKVNFSPGSASLASFNLDDGSGNTERVVMSWSSDIFYLKSSTTGTGAYRDIRVGNDNAGYVIFSAGGGARYSQNYGSLYTSRSLIDKGWFDSISVITPIGAIIQNFGSGVSATASSTQYGSITGNATLTGTENSRRITMPFACTLKNFIVSTSTAQPADGALTIIVRKNNTSQSVTLTIAASGAAGDYEDITNSFTVARGDKITVRVDNASASAGATIFSWSIGMYK